MLRNISVTLFLILSLPAVAQDRSTPEATVRSFLSAFEHADIKQAAACVKGAQMGPSMMDALAQEIKKDPATFTMSEQKTTLNGTSATFAARISLTSGKEQKPQVTATELNLVSSDGNWLIVPDVAKTKAPKDIDFINALAYVMTDTKALTQARDAARGTACLSNIKQIGLGALMFLQDYDEVFKLKAETYKKSLMPYIKNASLFKCPGDTGTGDSYSFNANLAGINMAKVKAPADTVMIYEGKNGQLNFRHDGKAAVGFANGRAKLVNAEEAKKLRWKP